MVAAPITVIRYLTTITHYPNDVKMQPEETVLSDVHIGTFGSLSSQGTLVSRFVFHIPIAFTPTIQPSADEDGDLEVIRRTETNVFHVEHAMSTTLVNVGLQVWRGALLMCDYIISHTETMSGAHVLELGAGTGLVSLVAAMAAVQVYCTDTGNEVLQLCQRNMSRNSDEMKGTVCVRDMDWTHPFADCTPEFTWSVEDMQKLSKTEYILAADVIYSDKLTDAFLECLAQICHKLERAPTTLLAFEKRVNFTLEDLAPVCPAYSYFMGCMGRQYPSCESGVAIVFSAKQLSTDFNQHLEYDRVKELVSKHHR